MKCPNCGGEIRNGSTKCEFCNSQVTIEMQKTQEILNKQGCPKCGSTNIKFDREKQGELKGKNGTAVIRKTVGLCHDCGNTWIAENVTNTSHKNNMIWWVLGWIIVFPVPTTILICRKKNTWNIKVKIAVTAVMWLLILIIGATTQSDEESSSSSNNTSRASDIEEITYNSILDTEIVIET